MKRLSSFVAFVGFSAVLLVAAASARADREVLRLDGTWEVAEGSMDAVPQSFSHRVPVPGLIDMAEPAFAEVGKKSPLREAFWYRRTFTLPGGVPPVAVLKIHKARYGTKVFLNGQLVGEHLPCFTPALLDVRKQLRGGGEENELVIRVGADRESLPTDVPGGWDFEKYLFIPGIYDSVELILTGSPYITNIQTVPDIAAGRVKAIVEIQPGDEDGRCTVTAEVREAAGGRLVYKTADGMLVHFTAGRPFSVSLELPIDDCRLWSPDDPFLYRLSVRTGGDSLDTRFGMREFRFDPATKRAMLNGKPYFMRGTNVCIYRFFEDEARGDLPWQADWVRSLHRKFKSMHWNSIRYCIGFPPEIWYDVADEEGFLIQDEFPIWLLGKAPEDPKAEKIIPEYTEWMRERWNHPCVVIWDAQNESRTEETGKALQAVRHLDLSNRPWENGWAAPQSPTDCVESHPYLFINSWQNRPPFRIKELAALSGVPRLQEAQKALGVPIIINEYAWLWLDRQGNPTCLTDKVYESLLGPNSTADQRRTLYARYLAALTEFWRCHRECAGVLHFCGLAYSRPGDIPRPEGGATSDHFLDLKTLQFEPHFEKYVRDAFNPVGLMLDFWDEELSRGPAWQLPSFRVFVINDRCEGWEGPVTLRFVRGDKTVSSVWQTCSVPALGRTELKITCKVPETPGDYTVIAELKDPDGRAIRSLRDVRVVK
jgi:hypothetical protein